MLNFLRAKGSYFVAFLVAFLLIFSLAISPNFAQTEIETEEDFYMTDEDMAEWDEAVAEWESAWEEYDESAWGDDFWSTGTTYEYGADIGEEGFLAALAIVIVIWGIIFLPLHIYLALTLMVTAKKLDVKNAWLAWVPIINFILVFKCAGLSPWLFLLMFIPFINIIVAIFAYMKIAERRGFESWLGILIILPIANLIIPGYLAWGEPPKKAQ